MKEQLRMEHYW